MYRKYPPGLKLTPEKQQLVEDNLGIAHKLTQKWFNGVCDIEDIRQEAYLTLVDCATKFDVNMNNKFSTYAYRCIDLRLNNYVQGYNRTVKFPTNKIYKVHKYLQLPEEERELYKLQNKITDVDIEFYKNYEMVSMDAQVVDDYDDVHNFYFEEESGYDKVNNSMIINTILQKLNTIISDQLDRAVFVEVIECSFDTEIYKNIATNYNIKLSEVYDIIERCQQIMKKYKTFLI